MDNLIKDYVGTPCGFSRWFITPHLVSEGEAIRIPESVSHPEDTLNIARWPEREGYAPWVFLPCLSSHYYLGRGFDGASQWENLIEEEVANQVTSNLEELSQELKGCGEEEFEENYGEEALAFMKTLQDKFETLDDIGWNFSSRTEYGYLYIDLWLGDCTIEPEATADPAKARFSSNQLQDLDTGDLEELDSGNCPGDWKVEDLDPEVLAYSLGFYIRNTLGEEVMGEENYWYRDEKGYDNYTAGLYQYLTNAPNTADLEDLSYGELEGPEVALRWLETIGKLTTKN